MGRCEATPRANGGEPAGPRVLLVAPATSYRISAFRDAARRLGIELVVASDGLPSLPTTLSEGLRVPLDDADRAVEIIRAAGVERPFAGIIGTDDAVVELASRAARALELPHNPPHAARISRRKDLARQCLEAHGVAVPGYVRIDLQRSLDSQIERVRLPCVVKPLSLSGSRGVIRADTFEELRSACVRAGRIAQEAPRRDERRYLLIEDYLPGEEIAVEGMLYSGRLQVLAMFDKPEPLTGPYFEESYYVTPSRIDAGVAERVRALLVEVCEAYELREGPVHAEFRIDGAVVRVLEVAARTIGGDCARLIELATGRALEDIVLGHAIGRGAEPVQVKSSAGVLMIPVSKGGSLRRVEGILSAQRVRYIEEVVIAVREGYELTPLPEGSSYLGFVFARASSPELVESALREAHACLTVVVAPIWRLEPAC